jgi:hypothetical protein
MPNCFKHRIEMEVELSYIKDPGKVKQKLLNARDYSRLQFGNVALSMIAFG